MLFVGKTLVNSIFIAGLLLLPVFGHARPDLSTSTGNNSVNNYATSAYENLMKIFPAMTGADPNLQDNIEDPMQVKTLQEFVGREAPFDLLDTKAPAIRYPPFPRTWIQYDLIKNIDTNTSWGFKVKDLNGAVAHALERFGQTLFRKFLWRVPVLGMVELVLPAGIGGEYSIRYTYSYKTSFVAMSSLRPLDPTKADTAPKVPDGPFARVNGSSINTAPSNSPLRSIINFDPMKKRAYFKTSSNYPIVGFCMFEVSLQIAETKGGSVEYFVGSTTSNHEEVSRFAYAVYSNFFEIENNVPIQEYLRTKCQGEFEPAVRYIAESDFNNMIAEFNAHYNPMNTCVLHEDPRNLDPKGDSSCDEWFKRQVHPVQQKSTVPRCEQGRDGRVNCVAKSKNGGSCPLYYDSKGALKPDWWPQSLTSRRATVALVPEYFCDKGTKCVPDEKDFYTTWIVPGMRAHCK